MTMETRTFTHISIAGMANPVDMLTMNIDVARADKPFVRSGLREVIRVHKFFVQSLIFVAQPNIQ